ncbi:MAG: hypothetical protein U0M60_14330 [Clostridia bacterium]|nr:hypothetical protein [Clostridia bacterium]
MAGLTILLLMIENLVLTIRGDEYREQLKKYQAAQRINEAEQENSK